MSCFCGVGEGEGGVPEEIGRGVGGVYCVSQDATGFLLVFFLGGGGEFFGS